jgi:hypothetical protein
MFKRIDERNNEAVVAATLWKEGKKSKHCNYGSVITHTHQKILISVIELDQIHY